MLTKDDIRFKYITPDWTMEAQASLFNGSPVILGVIDRAVQPYFVARVSVNLLANNILRFDTRTRAYAEFRRVIEQWELRQ